METKRSRVVFKSFNQNQMMYHNINSLQQLTKIIVIFILKYLRDYNNSHIFVLKDWQEKEKGRIGDGVTG